MNLHQAISRLAALGAVAGGVVWIAAEIRPLHYPPGILIADDPQQTALATPQPSIAKDGWNLQPLAQYSIDARVLGREHYSGDATAKLAPFDFALGWGRMSDESVLERLDISQGGRCYRWQYWGEPPVPEKEIVRHSANVHVIPADSAVEAKMASLRIGALVKFTGFLVEATHPQADRPWRSSLTRDDEGEGACEILYVRSVLEIGAKK